jgi:hypothetical protein
MQLQGRDYVERIEDVLVAAARLVTNSRPWLSLDSLVDQGLRQMTAPQQLCPGPSLPCTETEFRVSFSPLTGASLYHHPMWQLAAFGAVLCFFHLSEFALAAVYMREQLSYKCERTPLFIA